MPTLTRRTKLVIALLLAVILHAAVFLVLVRPELVHEASKWRPSAITLSDLPRLPDVPELPSLPGSGKSTGEGFVLAGEPAGTLSCVQVLRNGSYVVGYCEVRRNPLWVAYRLFPAKNQGTRRPSRFGTDDRTRSLVRHEDYTNSGFDRGHMAPSSAIDDCYGSEAQRETYLMTNVVPQRPTMNQQVWRELEDLVVRELVPRWGTVWVLTGPAFWGDDERLRSGVEVPDACWKVVAARDGRGNVVARAWIVPQHVRGGEPLDGFRVSVDEVERVTGLDLLRDLPDDQEAKLEAVQ